MSDRFFLDTNVLVYTFDSEERGKRDRARSLVAEALSGRRGVISYQVIQEFLNVALRKFKVPFTGEEAREYLQKVLRPLCHLQSSISLYTSALSIHDEFRFSFFDSLIVASAVHSSCDILYSEDLQHDQLVRGVSIRNPFI